MVSVIELIYPIFLANIATDSNHTIITDDLGIPHVVDIRTPIFTQMDRVLMDDSALQTTFHLYTRNNPKAGQELVIDDLNSVKNSFWNPDYPVRLVTHGWQGNCDLATCTVLRDAYLSSGDYNVILIDWRDAAGNIWYPQAAESVSLVAKRVSLLLNFLESAANLNPRNTMVVGHSLGGHVASLGARFAASEIAEVIALDPAKVLFESKGPGERTHWSDAIIVQGIHTNAGKLGLEDAIGISDFYPNNGKNQPGCGTDILGACAHQRAYLYYAESITNPKGFRAGNVFMGGPSIDRNAKGKYFLETASSSPFGLG